MTIRDRESWLLGRLVCDVRTRCWRWTGSHSKAGYGRCYINGRTREVHALAHELWVGPLPHDPDRGRRMDVDHVYARGCRWKDCANPAHLEATTNGENVRRAADIITHCPAKHDYTPENTYVDRRGSRVCKTCRRERDRARSKTPGRSKYLADKRRDYKRATK